jgi:hypothetical protein
MPLTLLATTDTQIIRVVEALYNQRPGNTYLSNFQTFVSENSIDAFANALAGNFASSTDAELAAIVTANIGLTGDALTAGNAYLEAQFAADAAGRGKAILDAMNALSTLEGDATYGAAATAYNADVVASMTYSAVATNTAVTTSDVASEVVAGQTYVLTTLTDTFTGTAGNDTFSADNTGATNTSSTADTLAGGEGADALSIYSDGSVDPVPSISSIETVNLYDYDDAAFSLASNSDVTTLNVVRGDGTTGVTVAAGTTVNLSSITLAEAATAVVITHAAATTSATIGLDGVVGDGDGTVTEDVTLVGAGLTTVVVNTSGTASDVEELDVAGATSVTINAGAAFTADNVGISTTGTTGTLTITGAGAVNIGTLDAGFDTVNAADNTGGVTLVLDSGTDTSVTLGSGNDTVSTDATMAASVTLAVDAGEGTADRLIVTDDADLNIASEGARYTNFETLRYTEGGGAANINMSLISGITKLESGANTSASFTNVTAEQASSITVLADQATDLSITLASAAGTSDVATFNFASATATTNVDAVLSVDNIETVNIVATTGTNTADANAISFLANMADEVTAINVSGTADVDLTAGAATSLDVAAVAIDASGLTGTGDFVLAGGILLAGSSVTGSAQADTIAISSTTGTTYDAGAGNDGLTGSVADLVATGANDNKINGGAGTDTLTLDDTTGVTLTDNHFTWMSNMETLALTATGADDVSITAGAAFNAAFANGVTITTGAIADAQDVAFSAGLSTMNINITVEADLALANAAGEDYIITTGSGDDTISYEGAGFVGAGAGADGGSIVISSGAGADTITVTTGTLLQQTTSNLVTITAGTGADTITKTSTNAAFAASVTQFVIANGDSTVAARDTITGFDLANTTFSDVLDFGGTGAVATAATSNDSGTIMSHSIASGIITFDDAASFGSAVTVNAANLDDVTGYLVSNVTTAGQTIAFGYDSTGDASADATMVFNAGATADSLVELAGVVATSLNATVTTTTASALVIA